MLQDMIYSFIFNNTSTYRRTDDGILKLIRLLVLVDFNRSPNNYVSCFFFFYLIHFYCNKVLYL